MESGDQVTANVIVDGTARGVPHDVLAHSQGLLVSVRKGHTAMLRVTDDDRTQSHDLRTGKRGADAIPAYYRPQAVSGLDESGGGYDAKATCPDVPYLLGASFPCSAHIIWLAITGVSYWVDPLITVAPGGGSFAIQDNRTFTIELPMAARSLRFRTARPARAPD